MSGDWLGLKGLTKFLLFVNIEIQTTRTIVFLRFVRFLLLRNQND